MAREPKLYQLTDLDFETFSHFSSDEKLFRLPAENVPMLFWPDGQWCLEANIYIQRLFTKGLSRKDRGGTLLTYAVQISHLIRFCANNRCKFIDLSNSQFTLFIYSLRAERNPLSGELVRENNTVIAIARVCLDFLSSVGELYDEPTFIGPAGQIRAERRQVIIAAQRRGSSPFAVNYWHHASFPPESTYKKRLPISTEAIAKLKLAVLKACDGNMYVRKRRYVMLKLLEITGARRLEISNLTVQSVLDAAKMKFPCLKLITVKLPSEKHRLVPISRTDLDFLLEFIKINRHRVIKSHGGKMNDDGFLLISYSSGKKLATNTITQEISFLCKIAELTSKACAHMFRHRFITKLFVALIEQHNLHNKEEFRRMLISSETLKQIVQEWTGHMSRHSVDRYISLAFAEVSAFAKSYNLVKAKLALDSARNNLGQIEEDITAETLSNSVLIKKLKTLLASLDRDLEDSQHTESDIDGKFSY